MQAGTQIKAPSWLVESAELKERVLTLFNETPVKLREKKPAIDAWSCSEIVEHLILVEEQVASPWRNKLGDNPPVDTGLRARILTSMVSAVMGRSSIRVPTVPGLVPQGGFAYPELSTRWAEARKQLAAVLPKDARHAWIIHPVFGALSSDQMGRLLVAHLRYHLRHWPKFS